MKVSTKGDYGVRALIELAHHYGEGPLQSAEIAARQEVPEPYLDQLLTNLRRAGFIRPITLWPFLDELFARDCHYVVCELNYDGQLVREVMRAAPDKGKVHFMGKSAELHTVAEVVAGLEGVARAGRIPELPYIWTEVR